MVPSFISFFIGLLTILGIPAAPATTDVPANTADGEQVVNSDFNSWFQDGVVWYPDLNLTPQYYFWDSGNKGVCSFGNNNVVTPETEFVVSGKAARLASRTIFGIFAAGSVYTGKFLRKKGMGAEISMGIPFTDKPKRFKGYYCYQPGTINKTDNDHSYLKGVTDTCSIYCILTDWDEPFIANTRQGKFVDINSNPGIIAVAQLSSGTSGTSYIEFDIPFEYRSTTRTPKYLLIVGNASKYGNFFTGSNKSVLYLDQFSLVYE